MAINRGKDFENILRDQFSKIPDCSVDRLHDQTTGFAGSTNICDLIVYKHPYEYYFECKAIHDDTLNFKSRITENQWNGLLEKSKIKGVTAGIICWFIESDVTLFLPIVGLEYLKNNGLKSFNINHYSRGDLFRIDAKRIQGRKRRVFFEYDLEQFLEDMG